jgi:hypothetical protein
MFPVNVSFSHDQDHTLQQENAMYVNHRGQKVESLLTLPPSSDEQMLVMLHETSS